MTRINYNQLPCDVQDIFAKSLDNDTYSLNNLSVVSATISGHNGVFAVPELNYGFHESNYTVRTINLTEVGFLDVGPASATMYVKNDPAQKAYLVIDGRSGDTDYQLYECL
mgnify:CR=1 FL=1